MSYDPTAVNDATIAHKKFVTLQMLRALRDNPLAMGAGDPDAPFLGGAGYLLATLENTVNVSVLTFANDVSDFRSLYINVAGELTATNARLALEVRVAGTWRTIAASGAVTSQDSFVSASFLIDNVNNGDGSGVVQGYCLGSASGTVNFNRGVSSSQTFENVHGRSGYTGGGAADRVRLSATISTIAGQPTKRAIARLIGVPSALRDAT